MLAPMLSVISLVRSPASGGTELGGPEAPPLVGEHPADVDRLARVSQLQHPAGPVSNHGAAPTARAPSNSPPARLGARLDPDPGARDLEPFVVPVVARDPVERVGQDGDLDPRKGRTGQGPQEDGRHGPEGERQAPPARRGRPLWLCGPNDRLGTAIQIWGG